MRRGLASILAAALLLAAASPVALAAKGQPSRLPALPPKLPLQPAPAVPGQSVSPTTPAPGAPGGTAGDWVGLMGIGAASLGLLALGLVVASRARRAKPVRAPKRTREGGRMKARALAPRTVDQAFVQLAEARLGALLEAAPIAGGARILVERTRGHPCEQVSGFLAGLFESVWAIDVRVEHAQCAGRSGPCRYLVMRADAPPVRVEPARLSGAAAPREAASTPGWPGAARRSPRARGGAG